MPTIPWTLPSKQFTLDYQPVYNVVLPPPPALPLPRYGRAAARLGRCAPRTRTVDCCTLYNSPDSPTV